MNLAVSEGQKKFRRGLCPLRPPLGAPRRSPTSVWARYARFSTDFFCTQNHVWINVISQGTLIKAFYLLSKINQKKSETWFCRRKAAEDNAKINVSPNTPRTFLHFEAGVFLKIFSPRNLFFLQVLRISAFINSTCLLFLYLFISLLKNIHSKHQKKEHASHYLLTNLFL